MHKHTVLTFDLKGVFQDFRLYVFQGSCRVCNNISSMYVGFFFHRLFFTYRKKKADLGIGKQVGICKKNKILKKSYYEN